MFLEDIGIEGTMLLAKKFLDDPIVKKGIPYENGFDVLCVYNGGWAIPPKGIEVDDIDTGTIGVGIKQLGRFTPEVEGIGYEAAAVVPTTVVTRVTIGGMLSEPFIVAIWSNGNILKFLFTWSKSLKFVKFWTL